MKTKKSGVRCTVCGRLLRSEKSKERGVGRDCATKQKVVISYQYEKPMSDAEALEAVKRVAGV